MRTTRAAAARAYAEAYVKKQQALAAGGQPVTLRRVVDSSCNSNEPHYLIYLTEKEIAHVLAVTAANPTGFIHQKQVLCAPPAPLLRPRTFPAIGDYVRIVGLTSENDLLTRKAGDPVDTAYIVSDEKRDSLIGTELVVIRPRIDPNQRQKNLSTVGQTVHAWLNEHNEIGFEAKFLRTDRSLFGLRKLFLTRPYAPATFQVLPGNGLRYVAEPNELQARVEPIGLHHTADVPLVD